MTDFHLIHLQEVETFNSLAILVVTRDKHPCYLGIVDGGMNKSRSWIALIMRDIERE